LSACVWGALAAAMIYQDYLQRWRGDAATALFELANLPKVAYRCRNGVQVQVKQDQDIEDCTGGIVWETAYLLATFLEWEICQKADTKAPKSVLEVGAGCGLLGLVLAAAGCRVVLTETTQAMANLQSNVSANKIAGGHPKSRRPAAMQLSWHCPKDRQACLKAAGGAFDYIVGTDVVFAERLVEPLLSTLHSLSDHSTVIWLCLQERCPEAHSALLKLAPKYFTLEDASDNLRATPGCAFASELDCVLLKLSRRKGAAPPGASSKDCDGRLAGKRTLADDDGPRKGSGAAGGQKKGEKKANTGPQAASSTTPKVNHPRRRASQTATGR